LAHGKDLFEIKYKVFERPSDPNSSRIFEFSGVYDISWDKLFEYLIDDISSERDEHSIEWKIGRLIGDEMNMNAPSMARVESDVVKQARYQLEALGLITAVSRGGEVGSDIVWTLTNKGRLYVSRLKAQKRTTEA
jgi:hypothetical protein